MANLELHLIWAAIAAAALAGGILYERHAGAAKIERQDAEVVAKQETHIAAQQAASTAAVQQETTDYEKATSARVFAVGDVRLCHATSPGPVLRATTAAGGPAAATDVPAAAQSDPDVGAAIEKVGQRADAQVAGLLDYISRVCLPPGHQR